MHYGVTELNSREHPQHGHVRTDEVTALRALVREALAVLKAGLHVTEPGMLMDPEHPGFADLVAWREDVCILLAKVGAGRSPTPVAPGRS